MKKEELGDLPFFNSVIVLDDPIIETEEIEITQIDKYENYLIRGADSFESGDISETANFLAELLKSLGHDGTLKIQVRRFVYEAEEGTCNQI